jgi:hypothetical protein
LSGPLPLVVSLLASEQIRVANDCWRANRPYSMSAGALSRRALIKATASQMKYARDGFG